MATKAKGKPAKKQMSHLTAELLETAAGMRATGLLPDAAYDKITMRH